MDKISISKIWFRFYVSELFSTWASLILLNTEEGYERYSCSLVALSRLDQFRIMGQTPSWEQITQYIISTECMAIIQNRKLLELWNITVTICLNIIKFAYICLFLCNYWYNSPSCREITCHGQTVKVCTLHYKDTLLGHDKGDWIWKVMQIVRM